MVVHLLNTLPDCWATLTFKQMLITLKWLQPSHKVNMKSFQSDNGIFAEKAFCNSLDQAFQTIKYCGVGAHHQNGITIDILLPFAWKDLEYKKKDLWLDKTGKWLWVDFFMSMRNKIYTPFIPLAVLFLSWILDWNLVLWKDLNGTLGPSPSKGYNSLMEGTGWVFVLWWYCYSSKP